MSNNKGEDCKNNYLKVFILIAIILLMTSLIYPFIVNSFYCDWAKSRTFRDTFGALNAFFSGLALAGIIVTILIQRTELKNQQAELRKTREEFLINRATSILYNQLDRFDKHLCKFVFKFENTEYNDFDATILLDNIKEIVTEQGEKSEEIYKAKKKTDIINQIKLLSPNKSEIEKFAYNIYNYVEELNDLKNLFLRILVL